MDIFPVWLKFDKLHGDRKLYKLCTDEVIKKNSLNRWNMHPGL